ncbi:MAG TPA: response regulator [Chitinophagaceae bacterium]|jgi:CheY-like chemotaxis protein|nr:response regulator [Chitinophagaceae bacterium]
MNPSTKSLIIYAEDDLDDFEALQEALNQITQRYELLHVKNGAELLGYLEDKDNKQPSLIVLDLNMPIMDGKQTLRVLKQHETFREIPVMVFTTSSREEDISLCKSHECTFFRKPTLYRDLLHIVQIMLQMSSTRMV